MTLAALLERRPIDEPVALVVAHPDDETLALGGSLHLFRRLLLIHVTDGAPQFLDDAAREGFDSPADYAAARAAELHDALSLVPWAPGADITRLELHIPDQAATARSPEIAARLQQAFGAHGIRTAVTHCYEGGHPDHDAVAMAVHRSGVETIEFAGYHADTGGTMRTGEFLPDVYARGPSGSSSADRPPETTVRLRGDDLMRKQAMIACFKTQRDILSRFDLGIERFRSAPAYDFSRPPHPGRLLYEQWGWMSGPAWREQVRCVA